jgi:hypothetical protein
VGGWAHNFFFKKKKKVSHIDWPISNSFGTLGMPPNRSTSLDPQLQNRNKCASLNFWDIVGTHLNIFFKNAIPKLQVPKKPKPSENVTQKN